MTISKMSQKLALSRLLPVLGWVTLVSAASLLSGCTSSGSNPTNSGGNGNYQINIQANAMGRGSSAFGTNPLDVTVGSKVTWTNQDSVTHTVTSDTNAFDSGSIAPGASYSFTFQSAGTYSYHCSIHTSMTGTIVVQ